MHGIGDLIKEKRKSIGLSQKALGDAVGISDTAVQRIESGAHKTPRWDTLCKIAKALGFHPFEILLYAGYITDEDLKPYAHPINGLNDLDQTELKCVQTFVNFIKAERNTDETK